MNGHLPPRPPHDADSGGQMVWMIHSEERGRRTGTTVYRSREEAVAALEGEAVSSREDGFEVEDRLELGQLEIWARGERDWSIRYRLEHMPAVSLRRMTRPRPRYAAAAPVFRPRLP